MAHWIKFIYDKSTYIIDIETVSAFSSEPDNRRISFWLPNTNQSIVLSPTGNPDAYKQVLDYIKRTVDRNTKSSWIKINYDRKEYAIDLSRIGSFVCESNGRLTFWLPDSTNTIIITPQGNPDAYQKIQEYIKNTTGHSMP
ncbi:MAG: hypothetical protein HC849_34375 [Oscillatoriales cyanobacterium RU_3_3]|nr:hypothetical protein [Microcoleus sp. SU_5_6]NJL69559.1 hypothetical protein [Microcoleus sp. SM1_3_4]NJM64077.1 hypothetical protein [Oscillatoriales cyanobacterium RU_3_3]NJR26264.1 hypothetical protein [Richelia sp. CSU_2_1]